MNEKEIREKYQFKMLATISIALRKVSNKKGPIGNFLIEDIADKTVESIIKILADET